MTNDIDQLSESFTAHEHLAPDAAAVLAKAQVIAQSYRRRRWAVRATGGAVLGAGLVAGGIVLPGRLGHPGANQSITTTQLRFGGQPTATPTPSPARVYTESEELTAYFAKGYDYNNAVQLARLWHDGRDIASIKAAAGLKLLEGESLPVTPNAQPESATQEAQDAFLAAGYDYADAVNLGKLWHETDLTQVKAEAGQTLLDGQTLPITPSAPNQGANAGLDPALTAYFAAGYDYADAVKLAKLWHETDPSQVKTEAGKKLLAGQTLPVRPSGTPESATQRAQDAFFAAGYTYDDALKLAKLWHETDLTQVKTEAGQKLLDGAKLPVAP